MLRRHKKRRAQATIEFAAVLLFILGALLVFQKYIVRGFVGHWKKVGNQFGQGRIYDPTYTVECAYKTFFEGVAPVWFNQDCFDESCEESCLKTAKNPADCSTCLASCGSSYCVEPD